MLDIKLVEKEPERFKKYLELRNDNPHAIDRLLDLNQTRKDAQAIAEEKKSILNSVSKEIPKLKKAGENVDDKIKEMRDLGQEIKDLQEQAQQAIDAFENALLMIPNILHDSVPPGKSEEENQIVRSVGEKTQLAFEAKSHDDLGVELGLLDFERAAKITGARFCVLRKWAARMERALINFMLDLHTEKHGYEEMIPPFMVNGNSMQGTGQFPKFREDVFHLESYPYHLIPTAEVPVTNYYAGEILDVDMLPQKFSAYTPCFRSEAGSHGKDTKGLIRQHQFNKVELVQFVHPDKSYEAHEALTSHAEEVLKQLELSYQVVSLCSGDISFGAAKCYDINVWLPGQQAYREISSCSNFEDFQARRANIRFREKGGKPQFVHTLNGSGLAVGRTLIAIFENYQQEDGSILIPKALQVHMKGVKVIPKD
tara:strand:+ start:5460 stop:6737 length:1278 start_codon:yes stop_codon:yes gene_type:complete